MNFIKAEISLLSTGQRLAKMRILCKLYIDHSQKFSPKALNFVQRLNPNVEQVVFFLS